MLGVVDPLQINGGDAEVRVAKPASGWNPAPTGSSGVTIINAGWLLAREDDLTITIPETVDGSAGPRVASAIAGCAHSRAGGRAHRP
jgi:hypothetical protein